ncbi:MAG: general secretion pathway protein GspK [Desulfobacterales bacterium]|nr:MAG: general secretion pathway protein GspK [Desulfobacterales bacterium]
MTKIILNSRGIALLITVSVTTILVAGALEYNRRARFTLVSTAAMRDGITLSQMTASGVHVAMAMLVKDKSESNADSLVEDWANPTNLEELLGEIPFEDGKLSVKISDEMGKIQINALVAFPDSRNFNESQVTLWDRFLSFAGDEEQMQDDSEPMAIINSIKDWLDSGDDDAITGLSGAESDYYQDLDPPYASRNGPMPDADELTLIKGITPELFYGSPEKPGISQFLTVHGVADSGTSFTYPGRININTAELPVIAALMPIGSEDRAEALIEYRQEAIESEERPDFSNPGWYKEIPEFGDVNINPKLIITSSDIFRIESEATLYDLKLKTTAVVQRIRDTKTGKWTCKTLSWKTD